MATDNDKSTQGVSSGADDAAPTNGGRPMLSQQTPVTLGLAIMLISIIAGCVAGYITLQVQVSSACEILATLDERYVRREVADMRAQREEKVAEKVDEINERMARMDVTLQAVAAKVGANN